MKVYRVHELVNFFHPTEFVNYPKKAIQYGENMHKLIQQRMMSLNPAFKAEYIVEVNYKDIAIIQGHVDLLNIKQDSIILFEIKPVTTWLKYGYRYDMQMNFYVYLTKRLFNRHVKAYYLLYYRGSFRKLPLVFRYSDSRIEGFIDEFLKAKTKAQIHGGAC